MLLANNLVEQSVIDNFMRTRSLPFIQKLAVHPVLCRQNDVLSYLFSDCGLRFHKMELLSNSEFSYTSEAQAQLHSIDSMRAIRCAVSTLSENPLLIAVFETGSLEMLRLLHAQHLQENQALNGSVRKWFMPHHSFSLVFRALISLPEQQALGLLNWFTENNIDSDMHQGLIGNFPVRWSITRPFVADMPLNLRLIHVALLLSKHTVLEAALQRNWASQSSYDDRAMRIEGNFFDVSVLALLKNDVGALRILDEYDFDVSKCINRAIEAGNLDFLRFLLSLHDLGELEKLRIQNAIRRIENHVNTGNNGCSIQ